MWQMIKSVTLGFACLLLSMMGFQSCNGKNTKVTLSLQCNSFNSPRKIGSTV